MADPIKASNDPAFVDLNGLDGPKMVRETVCVAQVATTLTVTSTFTEGSEEVEKRTIRCIHPDGHDGCHNDKSGWVEWDSDGERCDP